MSVPTPEDACRIAGEAVGVAAVAAKRFTTGLQHFVYEVTLADGRTVVARLTQADDRAIARSALALWQQLRPLGVPLPDLLGADMDAEMPWMLLARLPGRDLGDVVASLPDGSLRSIAEQVAAAQRIAATTPTASRYGFSATPQGAPFTRWSEVVGADLERSRGRIAVLACSIWLSWIGSTRSSWHVGRGLMIFRRRHSCMTQPRRM